LPGSAKDANLTLYGVDLGKTGELVINWANGAQYYNVLHGIE